MVKAASVYGRQPYHHPVPLSCNLGTLISWNPLGHSRPVMGLLYLYLYIAEEADGVGDKRSGDNTTVDVRKL